LLFALAPDYRALLASRVAMGLGAALIGPVLGALAAGLVEPKQQGSAIAMVLLGLSMAGLVGMPLSAWLAQVWGARVLFLAVGAAGLLTALLIRLKVPAQAGGQAISLATLGRVLTDGVLLPAYLVVFFIAAGAYATYAFIAPIIRDVFHGSANTVSAGMAVLGVAGLLYARYGYHANLLGSLVLLLLAAVCLRLSARRALLLSAAPAS
jgi:predicted MFS family arabinose efflux permease